MALPADTMVEIPFSHITVARKDGVWHFWGPPGTTHSHVVEVLAAQVSRLKVKHDVLQEALHGMMNQKSGSD